MRECTEKSGKEDMYAKHAIYYLHNSIFYALYNGSFNEHERLDSSFSKYHFYKYYIFFIEINKERYKIFKHTTVSPKKD